VTDGLLNLFIWRKFIEAAKIIDFILLLRLSARHYFDGLLSKTFGSVPFPGTDDHSPPFWRRRGGGGGGSLQKTNYISQASKSS
jgi:hypothetical protein